MTAQSPWLRRNALAASGLSPDPILCRILRSLPRAINSGPPGGPEFRAFYQGRFKCQRLLD